MMSDSLPSSSSTATPNALGSSTSRARSMHPGGSSDAEKASTSARSSYVVMLSEK